MRGSPARQAFVRRLASTLTLWALIAVAMVWNHKLGYFALLTGIGLKALSEYFALMRARGVAVFHKTGLGCAALYYAALFLAQGRSPGETAGAGVEAATLVMFLIAVFARQMTRAADHDPVSAIAFTVFGLLYVTWMFGFLAKILFLPPPLPDGSKTGQWYVLFALVVTKFSDMGAYVFGSLFGRHAMAPGISPKKTWEGFAGAILSALIGALWVYGLAGDNMHALRLEDAVVLGAGLGAAAVAGDLAESILKRGALAKDSGGAVPGIGGALDLVDSLLFTAPLFYFYLLAVAGH